jgi:hypothetical protein
MERRVAWPTTRLDQASRIAATWTNPAATGTQVMPATQSWSGPSGVSLGASSATVGSRGRRRSWRHADVGAWAGDRARAWAAAPCWCPPPAPGGAARHRSGDGRTPRTPRRSPLHERVRENRRGGADRHRFANVTFYALTTRWWKTQRWRKPCPWAGPRRPSLASFARIIRYRAARSVAQSVPCRIVLSGDGHSAQVRRRGNMSSALSCSTRRRNAASNSAVFSSSPASRVTIGSGVNGQSPP